MAYQKTLLATAIVCAMASASPSALADTQELEQLKRQLGTLLDRVEQLEVKTRNAEARAEAAEARVASAMPAAKPTAVHSGNDKIRVSVSGMLTGRCWRWTMAKRPSSTMWTTTALQPG
ncbi:hypothetical protein MBH78_19515 [Oceanimonas sp. NS1]|nr:hypothetical protein [Oceanimonas sp. NS1]